MTVKAIFYCTIISLDGEVEEDHFDFDYFEGNVEDLKKYVDQCGYVIGEPCYNGNDDEGILTEVYIIDDDGRNLDFDDVTRK